MVCQWSSRPPNWLTQLYWLGQFGTETAYSLTLLPSTGPCDSILAQAMSQIGLSFLIKNPAQAVINGALRRRVW